MGKNRKLMEEEEWGLKWDGWRGWVVGVGVGEGEGKERGKWRMSTSYGCQERLQTQLPPLRPIGESSYGDPRWP